MRRGRQLAPTADPTAPLGRRRLASLLIAAALALGACGGDDDTGGGDAAQTASTPTATDTGTGTPPPTAPGSPPPTPEDQGGRPLRKEQLLARGDRLCAKANRRLKALGRPRGVQQFAEWTLDVQGVANELVAGLRELRPPAGERRAYSRYIRSLERLSPILDRIKDAADRRDRDDLRAFAREFSRAVRRSNRVARSFGFDDCAR